LKIDDHPGVRDVQPRNHDNEVGEDLTQLVRVGGRCSYVLLALLFLILLYPDVMEWVWGRTVMAVLVSAIVLAIAYAVGRSRQRLLAASIFAVALLGLQWAYLATGNRLVPLQKSGRAREGLIVSAVHA
jgi:hypothetical protein